MTDRIVCLDTTVIIKLLTIEEQSEDAIALVTRATRDKATLVAPAWAWAEVGSVLRKKMRMGLVTLDEARMLWAAFRALPIDMILVPELATRAWTLAEQFNLPTLYDAAFLACTEVAPGDDAIREFWTADHLLVRQLGTNAPAYLRLLGV